jgi:hypothetical protein
MEMSTEHLSTESGRLVLENPDPRWTRPHLIEPSPAGFLHLAIQTRPRPRPGPVLGRQPARDRALDQVRAYARTTAERSEVVEATAFRAVLMAPGPKEALQPDVALLVQTEAHVQALALHEAPELAALLESLRATGARTRVVAASNVRRIADVDHARQGLFLFNHFFAPDRDLAIALWDRLAAWYEAELGLDNSMLLAPLEGEHADFAIVNHARFEGSLAGVAAKQFAKRSFHTYVRANLRANGVVAQPVLYRRG